MTDDQFRKEVTHSLDGIFILLMFIAFCSQMSCMRGCTAPDVLPVRVVPPAAAPAGGGKP